ncbi:enoyl-CoA hydratase-related protein [Ponticoccus sp. (in: a-proteobacteria)]|uniref:enoyl-CoA hydratase-related protein n=1 Tax=Ponticoccus sp. (in: a-proteobacteria) TaxID=1925025 RepID=UPI003AB90698
MTDGIVSTQRFGNVLEVTLNRPPVNAINRETSRAVYAAFKELQDDPTLRVGILTGAGDRVFSAGWDLKEVADPAFDPLLDADPELGHGPGGFGGITEFHDLEKPVIAALNGATLGGGFEIALACDVIFAADHTYFQLPEMQRGFLPDGGAIQRLPRRLPYNVAVELMLSGRRMDATEAQRWGLVHQVVNSAELLETVRAYAQELSKGAPLAMRAMKEVLRHIEMLPVEDAMAKTKPGKSGLPTYEKMYASDDFTEGSVAFAEKREPNWTGV